MAVLRNSSFCLKQEMNLYSATNSHLSETGLYPAANRYYDPVMDDSPDVEVALMYIGCC